VGLSRNSFSKLGGLTCGSMKKGELHNFAATGNRDFNRFVSHFVQRPDHFGQS